MRLLIVSEFVYSNRAPTAAGTRIKAVQEFFASRGWIVIVATPRMNKGPKDNQDDGVKRLTTYETRRHNLGSPVAAVFSPLSLAEHLHFFRKSRPDLAMISAYSPFLLLEPLIVARLLRVPVFFDVLDSWILMSAFHPGRIRNWLRRSAEKLALSHGDLVVGVTQTQVDFLARVYRTSPNLLMTVPRGIEPTDMPPRQPPVYDVIHVGPPRDYYDNEGLLDFLRNLAMLRPGLKAAYLGIEEGPSKTRLEDGLRRRGLLAQVEMIPPVPRSEVIEWTTKARAGLVGLTRTPVYKAAVSTKVYDYVAAGIPTFYLGPKDSEQGEFVRALRIGLVAETAEELAREAKSVLSDEGTLQNLRENARQAAAELAWNKVLEPLYDRASRLTSQKRRKAILGT